MLELARSQNNLRDLGFAHLAMGRTQLGLAITRNADPKLMTPDARRHLDAAVEQLRQAGRTDSLPPALLSRASFCRAVGDWSNAQRDLDEVEEIAEPGPMRLVLCDAALELARLSFARIEAFAPLSGMLDRDNAPRPVVPSVDIVARLKEDAAKRVRIADEYLHRCGYHRRNEEFTELTDVLSGKRTLASLPPRV